MRSYERRLFGKQYCCGNIISPQPPDFGSDEATFYYCYTLLSFEFIYSDMIYVSVYCTYSRLRIGIYFICRRPQSLRAPTRRSWLGKNRFSWCEIIIQIKKRLSPVCQRRGKRVLPRTLYAFWRAFSATAQYHYRWLRS